MPPPLLLRSHACPRHFIWLLVIVVSSHLHVPAVLFYFAVLLRALLLRTHLACNASAQCAVFTADGTVKGSTFDVIAALFALLRRASHVWPRLVPKSSPPSPKLGMTGTTRCSALPPSPDPHETPLSHLLSHPPPSRSLCRPSRPCPRAALLSRAAAQVGHGLKLAGYDFEVCASSMPPVALDSPLPVPVSLMPCCRCTVGTLRVSSRAWSTAAEASRIAARAYALSRCVRARL